MFNTTFLIVILVLMTYSLAQNSRSCSEESLMLSECVDPYQGYITSLKDVTGKKIVDLLFMRKFVNFTDTMVQCIGVVNCETPRHYLFFLNGLNYIGKVVYGKEAFDCFKNVKTILISCFKDLNTDYDEIRRGGKRQMMLNHITLCLLLLPTLALADVLDHLLRTKGSFNAECRQEYDTVLECMKPHMALYQKVADYNETAFLYNPAIMRKALQIFEDVSECVGDLQCKDLKHAKYFLEGFIFVGERVYGDAFHCFSNVQFVETFEHCADTHKPSHSILIEILADRSIFDQALKPVVDCIAEKMFLIPATCSVDRIVTLYKAGRASADLFYTALKLNGGLSASNEFNASEYCD
ncbi:unnamed protein product [Caenorhabditis sp. 36 PRJEB53466]|nr:unnamed protein product [Caenorhabditis sp. 36 PRJEB53466]